VKYAVADQNFVVLQVKIKPVGLPVDVLFRRRVNKKIDSFSHLPLVVVRSAAGYGKSCAVSLWAAKTEHRCAWFSLDKEDGALNRFWAYFVSSCDAAGYPLIELFEQALRINDSSSAKGFIDQVLLLLNQHDEPLYFILEDYHNLEQDSLLHESLSYFISQIPEHLHLIITSRVSLPLEITALREQGRVGEINEQDLSFTIREVQDLFVLSNQFLNTQEANFIQEYTKGWPVAVKLASLAYSQNLDIQEALPNFEVDRLIQEYLYEEVVRGLPSSIQEFLYITSCVPSFSVSLAQAITRKSAAEVEEALGYLKAHSLFVNETPGAGEEISYGYHALFVASVQSHIEVQDESLRREIGTRASLWYEEQGMINEAIDAASQFDDHARIEQLIARNWIDIHEHDLLVVLMHWFSYLPEECIEANPELCVAHVLPLVVTGDAQKALSRLEVAKGYLSGEKDEFYALYMGIKSLVYSLVYGDDSSFEPAEKAIAYLTPRFEYLKGACYQTLGGGKTLTAPEEALRYTKQSLELPLTRDNFNLLNMARSTMGLVNAVLGEFEQASIWLKEVLHAVPLSMHAFHPMLVYAYAGMAFVNYKQAQLDSARANVDYVLSHGLDSWNPFYIGRAYAVQAHLSFFEGKTEEAEEALAQSLKTSQLAFAFEFPSLVALRSWQAKGLLRAKAFEGIAQAESYDPVQWLLLSLQFVDNKEIDIAALEQSLASIPKDRILSQIEWGLLLACVYEREQEVSKAEENLARVIDASEGVGTAAQIFIENAEYVLPILERVCHKQKRPFAQKLLALIVASQKTSASAAENYPGLTLREKEVAQLLVAGLSTKEIAERLFISTATVKKHLANIYLKLNVSGRVGAMKVLQEQNLLLD
jgi:LuxR family maltose regulon positive regulatory protein